MEKEKVNAILKNVDEINSNEVERYIESLPDDCEYLTSEEEIIDDFQHWKEQDDIETEKILDRNYWAQM